ncbi:MAG: sarcosine oxidase, subunit gamma [Rhodobacteraceae bacterium HLUCCA12]|nr:MAG: sarcosine oxidase, subunit gamma [Rhodobacteraceae bacterium HLUCCA12]
MADLSERAPLSALDWPRVLGDCRLSPLPLERITAIQPFPGRTAAVDAALKAMGLAFPAPGELVETAPARIVWAGRETAFLFDLSVPDGVAADAAITDQSDGWAGLRLEGGDAAAVLARLVPVDLRLSAFAPGRSLRAPLNQMPALILRTGAEAFEIRVFRSMIETAVEDLSAAMTSVAARKMVP